MIIRSPNTNTTISRKTVPHDVAYETTHQAGHSLYLLFSFHSRAVACSITPSTAMGMNQTNWDHCRRREGTHLSFPSQMSDENDVQ